MYFTCLGMGAGVILQVIIEIAFFDIRTSGHIKHV